MEVLYGISNWKLTIKRMEDHIVILRAESCDRRAILPDELFGLPVTVLGDHALAPHKSGAKGEELRIVCGSEGDWDNRAIEELSLPASLTDVQNYALYGCRSLHTLHLYDRVERWGGGCLMNCGALRRICLQRCGDTQGESLAFLCRELHEQLDVSISDANGVQTRLLFPDFDESYEENFANHHFDYSIMGGGYAYHHVFRSGQLSLSDYDALWDDFLRHEHDGETAIGLAYRRLRWPVGLGAEAREKYTAYLRACAGDALRWQLGLRDTEGLSLLLDILQPDRDAVHAACEQARKEGDTGALALLLEKQHAFASRSFDRDFEL